MKKSFKVSKKALSLFLAMLMILTSVPLVIMPASAADSGTVASVQHNTLNHSSRNSDTSYGSIAYAYSDGSEGNTGIASLRFPITDIPADASKVTVTLQLKTAQNYNSNAEFVVMVAQQNAWKPDDGADSVEETRSTEDYATILGYNNGGTVSYSGSDIYNSVRSYYGITVEPTTYKLSDIGGNTYKTMTFDITEGVKLNKQANNEKIRVIIMHKSVYAGSSSAGWSDINVASTGTITWERNDVVTGTDFDTIDTSTAFDTSVTANAYGSYYNCTDNTSADELSAVYKNVLWAESNVSSAKISDYQVSYSGGGYANNSFWYPTVVFLDDGSSAMQTSVVWSLHPRDATARVEGTWMANSDIGIQAAWKGYDTRYNFQWIWHEKSNLVNHQDLSGTATTNQTKYDNFENGTSLKGNYSNYSGATVNAGNYYFASIMEMKEHLGSNEYKRVIYPSFYLAQCKDGNQRNTFAITQTTTANTPLYVVNYVPLRDAINDAKTTYENYIADPDFADKYTATSITRLANAINALTTVKPNNYDYSNTSQAVSQYAYDAEAAVTEYYAAKELVLKTYKIRFVMADGSYYTRTYTWGETPPNATDAATIAYSQKTTTTQHTTGQTWSPAFAVCNDENCPDNSEANPKIYQEVLTWADHTYGDWVTDTNSTCTATGTKHRNCTGCSYVEYGTVDMLEHTYNQEKAEAQYLASAATCKAKATYYKSCTCGAKGTETFESGELADHTYGSLITGTAATCITDGTIDHYTCSVCSKNFDENKAEVQTIVISKTGNHVYNGEMRKDADGKHSFKCTADSACTEYGEQVDCTYTYTSNGADETDTHTGTCACGNTVTTAHTWGEGVVDPDSTCEKEGTETFTCTVCSQTRTKPVATKAHTFGELVPEVPATCSKIGTKAYYECEKCGAKFDSTKQNKLDETSIVIAIDPNAHDYPDTWTQVTVDGVKKHQKVCTNNDTHVLTEICVDGDDNDCNCDICGGLVAHTYGDTWNFDSEKKEHYKDCTVCGERYSEACFGGTANCQTGATCDVCGNVYTDTLASSSNRANHTNVVDVAAQNQSCTQDGHTSGWECLDCKYSTVDYPENLKKTGHELYLVSFNWDENAPNATATLGCTHSWHTGDTTIELTAKEIIEVKVIREPTCTLEKIAEYKAIFEADDGTIIDTETFDSGYSRNETYTLADSLDPNNHVSLTKTNAVTATCEKGGNVDYWTCDACKELFIDDKGLQPTTEEAVKTDIDSTNHTNLVYTAAKSATCTESGNLEYWYCDGCEKYYSNAEGTTETTLENVTLPALEHNYTTFVGYTWNYDTEDKVPTAKINLTCKNDATHKNSYDATVTVDSTSAGSCQEKGTTTYKASYEGFTQTSTSDPVDGALGAHTIVKVAAVDETCTTDGNKEHYKCTVEGCGKLFSDAAGTTETTLEAVTIKAAHILKQVDAKDPTCTEIGWDAYEYCTRCDYTTYAEKSALGHDYKSVVTAPTCTEKGYTTHTCSRCSDSYTDSEKDALGHIEETVKGYAATCTTTGLTDGIRCSRETCGDTIKAQEVIPATGHSYETVVTDPTCTEKGYTTHTCSNCGDTYMDSEVNATGHNLTVTEITAPTCTEKGVSEFKCSSCDYSYTASVDALGHTEVDIPAVEATCTTAGSEGGKKCSVCDTILKEPITIQALGHDYNDGVLTQEPTNKNEGIITYTCQRAGCGYTYTAKPLNVYIVNRDWTEFSSIPNGANTLVHGSGTLEELGITSAKYWNAIVVKKVGNEYVIDSFVPSGTGKDSLKVPEDGFIYMASENSGHHKWISAKDVGKRVAVTFDFENAEETYKPASFGRIIIGVEHVHTYGEWSSNGNGYHTRQCLYCTEAGNTQTEKCVNANPETDCNCDVCGGIAGHTWTPATCLAPKTCSVCGATEGTSADHSYGKYIEEVPALCESAGVRGHYVCSTCNKNFDKDYAEITDLVIPAKDHKYAAVVFEWSETEYTCTAKQICDNDSKHVITYTVEAGTLTLTEDETARKNATCTTEGERHFTARVTAVDGTTATEDKTYLIAALGHKDENSDGICDVCGNTICTHTSDNTEIRNFLEADCENEGYTGDIFCLDCNNIRSVGEVVPPLGHIYKVTKVEWSDYNNGAPTCVVTFTCQRRSCGKTGTDTNAGVTLVEGDEYNKAPSCTEDGYKIYTVTSTFDGAVFDKDNAFGRTDYKNKYTFLAEGHRYNDAPEYTWTENGDDYDFTASFKCSFCDKTVTYTETVKGVTTEAGCDTTGSTVYTAKGTYIDEDSVEHAYDDTHTVTILVKGHDFSGAIQQVGDDKHYFKCVNCDKYGYNRADGPVVGETLYCEFVNNTDNGDGTHTGTCECGNKGTEDHVWLEWTQTEGANTHTGKCMRCTATDTQNCADHDTDMNCICDVCGRQLEHDYKTLVVKNDGTHAYKCVNGCEKENTPVPCSGGTATCVAKAVCSVCNAKYGDIDSTNHDYDTTKSEDNLTRPVYDETTGKWSQGYYTYICSRDENHKTKEYVDRANYTEYDKAVKALEDLLTTDITDEAKKAINDALTANEVADDLIESEQDQLKVPTANLEKAFTDNSGSLKTYKVEFVADGKVVDTQTIISGKDATAPTTNPTKAPDETNHYEFKAWIGDYTKITADTTITAEFTSEGHKGGTATCTEKAECSVCHTEYGNTAPDNHDFTKQSQNGKYLKSEATCMDEAVYYYGCTRCDAVAETTYTFGEKNPENHTKQNTTTKDKVEATCTTDGKYTDTYCECGVKIETGATIPALGHNWTGKKFDWSADCKTCTVTITCERNCEEKFENVSATPEVTREQTCTLSELTKYTVTVETSDKKTFTDVKKNVETKPAAGHSYKADFDWTEVEGKAPTCKLTLTCEKGDSTVSDIEATVAEYEKNTWVGADCTTDGKQYYKATATYDNASYVSDTYTVTITKLGHDFTDNTDETSLKSAANCTDDAVYYLGCSRCDAVSTDDSETWTKIGTKWGHKFDGAIKAEADGKHSFKCTNTDCGVYGGAVDCTYTGKYEAITGETKHTAYCVCGNITVEACADVDTDEDCNCDKCDALVAHTPGEWIETTKPTCTTKGEETLYCSVCNEVLDTKEVKADGHSYTAVVTAPTCTEKGYTTYTCHCGDTYTANEVNALDHDYTNVDWTNDGKGNHYKDCTRCGDEGRVSEACADVDTDTDCNCDKCGALVAHDYADATCTKPATCKDCGATTGDALGHDLETTTAKDPTCTEGGWKEYVTCKREGCGYSTFEENKLPAIEHKNKVYHEAVTALCNNEGNIEYWYCPDCNANYSDEACTTKVDSVVTTDPDNHKYTTYVYDENATCTADGTKTAVCANGCGKTNTIADPDHKAHGHNYEFASFAWDYSTAVPTCIVNLVCSHDSKHTDTAEAEVAFAGYDKGDCQTLESTTYKATYGEETELSVPVNGTNYGSHNIEFVPATGDCQTDGNIAHYKCTVTGCNELYADEEGTTPLKPEDVVAKGEHTYTAVVTDPTCTSKGYTTYTCSRCGDTYIGDETEMAAHTAGTPVFENNVDATCGESGSYDEVVYCTVCNFEISRETKTTDAIPHTEGEMKRENIVEATCKAGGSYDEVIRCTVCNKVLSRISYTTPKIDSHSFTKYKSDKNATCFEDGTKTAFCDYGCGTKHTVKDEGSAIGEHSWGEWVVETEKTCKTYEIISRTCTVCKEKETYENASGGFASHALIIMEGKEATCETDGLTDYTYCVECGEKTQAQVIPAYGHKDDDGDGSCDHCFKDLTPQEGDGCICHKGNIFSKIVRFIYTIFSKLFRKKITCCPDMEFYGGGVGDIS